MAASLSTQLEGLRRERERLEELLMLDANWRALRQLDERETGGHPLQAVDGAGLRAGLEKALAANRIYVARAKLVETIELLEADFPGRAAVLDGGSLSSRIVMLSEPSGDTFRARLRLKPEPVAAVKKVAANAAEQVADGGLPICEGASSLSTRDAGDRVRAETVAPATVAVSAVPDPLELIDGLSRQAVEMLLHEGVNRFSDIAAWSSVEVATWRARLEGATQGSAGWWIEQAALLASGRNTHFAERARRGEFAALVAPPQSEPPGPWSSGAGGEDVAPQEILKPGSTQSLAGSGDGVGPPALPDCALAARGVTAEELARVLDHADVSPPPLPEAAVDPLVVGYIDVGSAVTGDGSASVTPLSLEPLAGRSVGGMVDDEADVVVVAAPVAKAPLVVKAGERPRTLLKRIKALHQTGRFEADDYAAYRGSVEEASVTILATAKVASEPSPPLKPAESSAAKPANRFLKALTGKS